MNPLKIKNRLTKKIVNKLPKTAVFSPSDYNIPVKYTGKNVKIAVIDSGCPVHKDIKNINGKVNFCNNNKVLYDRNGHSTIVSGIIAAKSKNGLTGLAPSSKIYSEKVVDYKGVCSFSSLIAAILWAVVKKVDIIMIALGTQYDYEMLHDAIKKAYNSNICIIASAGNNVKEKDNEIDYPARYKEVFSVGGLTKNEKQNKIIREKVNFTVPNKEIYSTYLNDKYVQARGSSISTAITTALAALLIEKRRESFMVIKSPEAVYSDILTIST
jgi:subtilisin family serine protease